MSITNNATKRPGEGPSGATAWWKSAVVYQIYPRSFQDSDDDGIGDIQGIRRRLDHLQRLGVDAIWLSPIYRSPHADAGYDISDYDEIDPVFGSMAEFENLLADVHGRGMKLIMDLVVNHTSDEHEWFAESRASKHSHKRDWYVWRDARSGTVAGEPGSEPNNWGSFFSGPAWTFDAETGQYYLHLFHEKQPDLNWDNPAVRHEIYGMMRRWLDRGVDGFRMDVINLISKDPELPDGPVPSGRRFGDGFRSYASGPRLHEFLQEMNREVFASRSGLLTVGEMPGVTPEDARLFTDPTRHEIDMVFQFDHVGLDHGPGGKFDVRHIPLGELADSFTRWQEALADAGWNSLYISNHDQPRPVSRFGDDRRYWRESATALATAVHLLRGTPYIYQGEEIGMTNASFRSADDFRDIESRNYLREHGSSEEVFAIVAAMSRDNARTPVQWDASSAAGFTKVTPWMPVAGNVATVNAQAQYGVPGAVFEHYRALIALRHDLPVVAHGTFTRRYVGERAVFAYERQYENEQLLVVANLSSEPCKHTFERGVTDRWRGAELLLSNVPAPHRVDEGTLAPWEANVFWLRS